MVVCSAILRCGQVFVGRRHHDIIHRMAGLNVPLPVTAQPDGTAATQGFIDERGRFMDRAQAFEEAARCGQVGPGRPGPQLLFSEDLY